MVKIVKLNPYTTNRVYKKSTNESVNKITNDPDICIEFEYTNNNKEVKKFTTGMENVSKQYNGLYYVFIGTDKYLLDDGYYNSLVKAGYIVLNDYNTLRLNTDEGEKVVEAFRHDIKIGIMMLADECEESEDFTVNNFDDSSITVSTEYYKYKIILNPITDIINNNQVRKLNDLPFYPYIKDMDKYGSMYIRTYAQLNPKYTETYTKAEGISKFSDIEILLRDLIISMNQANNNPKDNYHYEAVPIKKMIIEE